MNEHGGPESGKTWYHKHEDGFFKRFMWGNGIEIGYRGHQNQGKPILDNVIGIDLDTPGYDGITLPFEDSSQWYVYSSHCLEHISDYKAVLKEWMRVLKPKGHMIIVVPHRDLYEKKLELPSRFNPDHKRFYTASSLLKELEDTFPINSYRIRHMRENDEGHDYDQKPEEHSLWLYEIEVVVQRIK